MAQWMKDTWVWVVASPWFKGGALLALATAAFVLGGRGGWYGVSSLEVKPLSETQGAPGGIVYYLPQSIVEADLTFRVTKCDVEISPVGAPQFLFDGVVTAELKLSSEPDLTRGYVIRSQSMDGAFWRTDLAIDLNRGMLKSLNAVTVSEFKPPAGSDLVTTIQEAFKVLLPKDHSAGSDALVDRVRLREQVCGVDLITALDKAQGPEPKAGRADIFQRSVHIVPGEPCPAVAPAMASDPACVLPGMDTIGRLLRDPGPGGGVLATRIDKFSIALQITEGKKPQPIAGEVKGIVYRIPGSATLSVCLVRCQGTGGRILLSKTLPVAQFGSEAIAPAERRLFSDRTTKLAFSDTGELVKATFNDARAAEGK
jgi:hypothetical protein